jgi:hypothetical protein
MYDNGDHEQEPAARSNVGEGQPHRGLRRQVGLFLRCAPGAAGLERGTRAVPARPEPRHEAVPSNLPHGWEGLAMSCLFSSAWIMSTNPPTKAQKIWHDEPGISSSASRKRSDNGSEGRNYRRSPGSYTLPGSSTEKICHPMNSSLCNRQLPYLKPKHRSDGSFANRYKAKLGSRNSDEWPL